MHTGNPDDPWALNLLTPAGWDHGLLTTMLDRARDLGMNHIKFFLPIGQVLPDPQPTDGARLVDGTEERVRILLDEAAARGYGSPHADELGGNGCQWRRAVSTGDLGRMLPRDSFVTLADFWRQMAALCRDRGALLSYNLAVEWTLPNGNLTWEPEPRASFPASTPCLHSGTTSRLYHGTSTPLNAAWGDSRFFNDVTLPDLAWDGQARLPTGWSATITSSASGPRCATCARRPRRSGPSTRPHGHCGRPRAHPADRGLAPPSM